MTWATPPILNVGDLLTATDWNIIAGDLSLLSGAAGGVVNTSESSSTTGSWLDLTTVGPIVTVSTLTSCIVYLTAGISNSSANATTQMGIQVSGASSVAAPAGCQLIYETYVGGAKQQQGAPYFVTGLTPGINIFTAKYFVNTGTGTYLRRNLVVIPLSF